ncbi:hypothetical protein DFJ74DRAFT_695847 [Hyaloraphidium curvatum]|nr:hypothetical protein DFJ74DRAFT_695847 [Hyaloraphidium curvatum]
MPSTSAMPRRRIARALPFAALSAALLPYVAAQKTGNGWPEVVDAGYGMLPANGTRVSSTGWMCMEWLTGEGLTVAIRIVNGTAGQPSGGDPACFSEGWGNGCKFLSPWDGAPWQSKLDWGKCQEVIDGLTAESPYLACGEPFLNLFKEYDGYDPEDPESWCSAGALALDLRPDGLRRKVDYPPLATTFGNYAGRMPNYPTKEQRPAPRPEGTLMGECVAEGWGCGSCDEIRYQCNDGIARSCEFIKEIPATCPGNGVQDPRLAFKLEQEGGKFTLSRYTQTSGRSSATPGSAPQRPAATTATTTSAPQATGVPVEVDHQGTTRIPEALASRMSATATTEPTPPPKAGGAAANVMRAGAAVAAAGAAGLAVLL